MKTGTIITMAVALGVAAVGPSAAAPVRADEIWAVASAPDGSFTVDTPCNAGEIDAMKAAPSSLIPNMNLAPESRVICIKGSLMFVAGVMDAGAVPTGKPSLFDTIIQMAANDKTAEGKPVFTTIGGRRAFINRQEQDGVVAQTGIIEVSPSKAVFLVAGAPEGGVSAAEQGAAIDRFYASIKVAAR